MSSATEHQLWKVLIIDDDQEVAKAMELVLSPPKKSETVDKLDQLISSGDSENGSDSVQSPMFECDVVKDGRSGFQQVVEAGSAGIPYAVVSIDMRMPEGWDGLETARQIRSVDEEIQIIFVTAWMDYSLEEIQQSIGYKFNFLSKPIRRNEFLQLVTASAFAWSNAKKVAANAVHLEEYHQQITESLALEKEHIELVFEAMNEAVVMVDRLGNIEGFNIKLSKMTAWQEEELAGRPLNTLFVENEQSGSREHGLRAEPSRFNVELLDRLQHSLERWIDASLLAVMQISAEGIVLQSNYSMEMLSGWCSEDLVGETLELMLPHEIRGHHDQLIKQFVQSPEIRRMGGERILPLVCKDGARKPVEIALVPINYRGDEIVLVVLHDPVEQQKLDLFKITPFGSLFVQNSNEDGVETDWELRCKEGAPIPVHVTASPVYRDWEGRRRFNGAVLVLRDLRKLIEAEATERAGKAKDNFLASMSHELRTPLATIIGNSELLTECDLTDQQQQLLAPVVLSGKNLLALVNDVLDLSKMESGKFEIDAAPFSLEDLLEEVTMLFSTKMRESSLRFEVQQQVHPLYKVWGDRKRIGQILLNLLSNAQKFTQQGRVSLECQLEGETICFSVEDTGIGMSAEVMNRLFKPFEQADSSISRRFGGTGLGLHISWNLAEMMGGDIEVSSREGEGSRFVLKLPYRESDLKLDASQECSPSTRQQTKYFSGEVLVVEDTRDLQLLLCHILELMQVKVSVANNGLEAVEQAMNRTFELILMDMQMPLMDGLEATAQLRELGNVTPIIALTANVMQKHRDAFNEVGCNGFLEKPIDRLELQKVLQRYLKPCERQEEKESVPDLPSSQVQPSCAPVLAVDDEEGILELYQLSLEESIEREYGELLGDMFDIRQPVNLNQYFSVSLAKQGALAVDMAKRALEQEAPFPVAFIDMRMPPGMNGMETAKALRALDSRIYIVFVTAYSDVDLNLVHQELGHGVLYLRKPFEREEIVQIARLLTGVWEKEHGGHQRRENLIDADESSDVAALDVAPPQIEVSGELMALFYKVIAEQKEEISVALNEKDWKRIRLTAHTIKGSASSFGFFGIGEIAARLQDLIDEQQIDQVDGCARQLLGEIEKAL